MLPDHQPDRQDLLNAIVGIAAQVTNLKERFDEHKDETKESLKEMREEHAKTRDALSRGRGALHVLTFLGALVTGLAAIWYEVFRYH